MQTYDQALFDLYKSGQISYQDALSYADSTNDLRLMIKLDKNLDSDLGGQAGQGLQIESFDSGKSL